ncbi:TPA: hypothetical protein PMC50_002517 [Vibrio cholerae]|nr:hypothetical protein [Vibrio cholerae]
MIETNFISFLLSKFPSVPVYSFYIPENAPSPAMCFENVGQGVYQQYIDGSELIQRTIKLTLSSTDVKDIYEDSNLQRHINSATAIGDLPVLKSRIQSITDRHDVSCGVFEREYLITIKIKGE